MRNRKNLDKESREQMRRIKVAEKFTALQRKVNAIIKDSKNAWRMNDNEIRKFYQFVNKGLKGLDERIEELEPPKPVPKKYERVMYKLSQKDIQTMAPKISKTRAKKIAKIPFGITSPYWMQFFKGKRI